MTDRIVLHTSLPPTVSRLIDDTEVGQAYLFECVRSWRRAGFDVVSLNSAMEIEQLRGLSYDVEFSEIGGHRPAISDFLGTIRSSGRPVAGIINADILLSNDVELVASICDRSASGMTMIERINIDPVRLAPTGRSCYGFDAFVFRTDLISQIDAQHEFLFGQPWWDYWFPLAYAANGGKLMTVTDPLLFHLDHTQNWSQERWLDNARKTVDYFSRAVGKLPSDFAKKMQTLSSSPSLSEGELGPFGHWCFARLRSMAELIRRTPGPINDHSLQSLLSFIDDRRGFRRGLMGELNEARACIVALREEVGANPGATWVIGGNRVVAGLFDHSNHQDVSSRLRSEVCDAIQHMSRAVGGGQITRDEDGLLVMIEGARILVSRKATLSHFVALNSTWVKGLPCALAAALKLLREALSTLPKAIRAVLAALPQIGAWREVPSNTVGRYAGQRQLRLAREEGAKYLAAFEFVATEIADSSDQKQVGDYIVAFAQERAAGAYGVIDGKLTWFEPDGEDCRIDIAVLDAGDKRFVPGLTIRARLTDADGREIADLDVPFVWHPGLHHYGANVKVPKAGPYALHVTIDPPTFLRDDRTIGRRYMRPVEVTFEGVQINTVAR